MDRKKLKKEISNFIINLKNKVAKIPKKTKIILVATLIIVVLIITLVSILIKENSKQKYVEYNGNNLNESKYPGYKEQIDQLKEKHPNWTFTLFYTRLDWEEVIKNEGHSDNRKNPLNLIPDSSKYPEDWKCEIDRDKTYDNGTWLCASDKAIKYQMDPRNILNEDNIFQLKELAYVENAQTVEGISKITDNTFLEGEDISNALIQAGKNANLDPYFIASRLIQEQGRKGTTLSKGYEYKRTVVYNVFNISASGNSAKEIIENAAQYAYEKGWDTLEKSLIGGVDFVKKGYIDKGQNTLYLQKFDIVNRDEKLYTNQYMQNLLAPESEASNMLKIYETSDTIDSKLNFIIPLYENMPEKISEK